MTKTKEKRIVRYPVISGSLFSGSIGSNLIFSAVVDDEPDIPRRARLSIYDKDNDKVITTYVRRLDIDKLYSFLGVLGSLVYE